MRQTQRRPDWAEKMEGEGGRCLWEQVYDSFHSVISRVWFVNGGRSGELRVGVGQETSISESGTTSHATPSAIYMSSDRQARETLRTASGQLISLVGRGNLNATYRSSAGDVTLLLREVTYAPELHYNLFSLVRVAGANHKHVGESSGISFFLRTGEVLNLPSTGQLNYLYGTRNSTERCPTEIANAVVAPGSAPLKHATPININDVQCVFEVNLRNTAAQMGVTLKGELHGCKGCSIHKGARKPIKRSTSSRADRKLGRVFVDLSGPKPVESLGGRKYTLFIRDDFSRDMWMYCLRHKSEAAEGFERWLTDVRADGVPLRVAIVGSNNGF